MLEAPRELLARALFPLKPPEPPPKPPPLALGLEPRLAELAPAERLLAVAPPEVRAPCWLALAPPRACCCPALAWRVERESPRALPPYLLAVALSA